MADLIKPKDVTVKDLDGNEVTFTISRFPTVAGREITTQYPVSSVPKLGDYKINEDLMRRMMGYVEAYKPDGGKIRLTTDALINNHVPDANAQLCLEWEVMGYNTNFFGAGKTLSFFTGLRGTLMESATSTLTALSEALLQAIKQRSKS